MRNWMLLPLAMSALTVSCGGGADSGPTEPNEGTLEVLASTTGTGLDVDGYTVSVDSGDPQLLPSNGADTVASLSPGTHTVALAGVAPNCLLSGENPRTVEITAADMTSLRFDIACTQPPEILVSAATTGEELDSDGYRVAVDGGPPRPLAINGSVRITGVTPGEHDVVLSDVADNCVLAGSNPLRVTVAGGTASADFTVSCSGLPLAAPGHDIALSLGDIGSSEVYLLRADGTTLTNLTNDPGADDGAAWSPDGQRIAFSSTRQPREHIFVMNADGSGQTQLTSGDYFAFHPTWSPDGSKIAFASTKSGRSEIYVMNSDGGEITQLTDTRAMDPVWSPNGAKIAFRDLRDNQNVSVMNADGSGMVQLTTESSIERHPAWSPDGTRIVFASDRSGSFEIYVMNADGTGVTQLTFGTQGNAHPAWSPDGSKIAFVLGWATGADRLYMMNPDGTDQVALTRASSGIGWPAWRP
jgi:Tol biopolymer transport system component